MGTRKATESFVRSIFLGQRDAVRVRLSIRIVRRGGGYGSSILGAFARACAGRCIAGAVAEVAGEGAEAGVVAGSGSCDAY